MNRRRFCVQILEASGITSLTLFLSRCSQSNKLTAPTAVTTAAAPLPQTPIDLSRVGSLFASVLAGNQDETLLSALSPLGPVTSDYSGVNTETGEAFSGFYVTSFRNDKSNYGYVIAVNNGHVFLDNIQEVELAPNSRVDIYYGLACPDPGSC